MVKEGDDDEYVFVIVTVVITSSSSSSGSTVVVVVIRTYSYLSFYGIDSKLDGERREERILCNNFISDFYQR